MFLPEEGEKEREEDREWVIVGKGKRKKNGREGGG